MYLDALWSKDATSIVEYSDLMVDLLAEYEYPRLLDFLRSSTSYNLEKVRLHVSRAYVWYSLGNDHSVGV